MFDLDHWREIANVLGSNKLRTGLTAFGVFWGLFMLMVMLGAGRGLENGVSSGFAGEATNCFFVWTQSTGKAYRGLPVGRRFDMTLDDRAAIVAEIPEADVVAPRCQLAGYGGANNVTRETRSGAFNVMGDVPDYREVEYRKIVRGRFLNPLDVRDRRKIAVIGTRVQEVLFDSGEDPIGQAIRVNGVSFKVVGVYASIKSGEQALRDAETIHVPLSTFQQAFNRGRAIGWFAITSDPGVPASAVEARTLDLLRRRHRVAPDDERAFGHFNMEEEYNQVQDLFDGISLLIWIVGTGTLAAGVIGVSNIMLVVVKERTHEIGVRRAIGATPWAVVSQVLLEAVLLTAVAGYLGLVAGIGLVELGHWIVGEGSRMFRAPAVETATALQALGILVCAGTLAGLMPARRAVAIRPVDALRAD